jgi:hypothetical protein
MKIKFTLLTAHLQAAGIRNLISVHVHSHGLKGVQCPTATFEGILQRVDTVVLLGYYTKETWCN